MDNAVDFRETPITVSTKQISVAYDTTTECVYISLLENYNEATKMMVRATEICRATNTTHFQHILKSLDKI
jgi:hypothetical protein